jgi:hypothetical protein
MVDAATTRKCTYPFMLGAPGFETKVGECTEPVYDTPSYRAHRVYFEDGVFKYGNEW